jgi:hypothetical protein
MKQFTSEKTLLFVHGATQPAEATFDLPLEGLSWMDYIAQHGWDVYLGQPSKLMNRIFCRRHAVN